MDGLTTFLLLLIGFGLLLHTLVTIDAHRRRKQEDYLKIRPTLFAGMDAAAMDHEIRKFNRE